MFSCCHLSSSACPLCFFRGLHSLKRFTVNSPILCVVIRVPSPRSSPTSRSLRYFASMPRWMTSMTMMIIMFDFTVFFQQLLQHISSDPLLRALTFLDLSCNVFPPSACTALAAVVPHLPALQQLDLSQCGIDTTGTSALAPRLPILTQLRSLKLAVNRWQGWSDGALSLPSFRS